MTNYSTPAPNSRWGTGLPIEISDVVGLEEALDSKVDKEEGKGLSTNDFTDPLLAKLNDLENYDDTALTNAINELALELEDKVDKVEGLGLSQESFTTEEKSKLASLENYDPSELTGRVEALEEDKVDKLEGWGLSQENFTLLEKNKLAGLENYDDTALALRVTEVETSLLTKAEISQVNDLALRVLYGAYMA